jgi:hypothetical protein
MSITSMFATNYVAPATTGFAAYANGFTNDYDLYCQRLDAGDMGNMPLVSDEDGVRVYLREELTASTTIADGCRDASFGTDVTTAYHAIVKEIIALAPCLTSAYFHGTDKPNHLSHIIDNKCMVMDIRARKAEYTPVVPDHDGQADYAGTCHVDSLRIILRWDTLSPEDMRSIVHLMGFFIATAAEHKKG